MWELIITTPWTGNGTSEEMAFQPSFMVEYGNIVLSFSDITGQSPIPNPNAYSIKVVCPYSSVDIIKADPNYLVWSEEEIIDATS